MFSIRRDVWRGKRAKHASPLRPTAAIIICVDISSLVQGYSKGLYSSWLHYKPDHLLVDCGEGCASSLGNSGYAIERVLLTHGHIDHIAGLPVLLWARAAGMGDNEKPLQIYYPRDDQYIADMMQFLERTRAKVAFDLQFISLDENASIPLTESGTHARRITTFATQHMIGRLTLGYKILETRSRLKIEYSKCAQNELRDLSMSGAALSESYEATIAAFGGDGLALNVDDVRDAELLVHEATILDANDRKHQLHATVGEALQVARDANVKTLLLQHFSGRYRTSEIKKCVQDEAARVGVTCDVWCLFRDKLWREIAR